MMSDDGVAQFSDDSHMEEEDEQANEALEQVSAHPQLLLHSLPASSSSSSSLSLSLSSSSAAAAPIAGSAAGSKHYHKAAAAAAAAAAAQLATLAGKVRTNETMRPALSSYLTGPISAV